MNKADNLASAAGQSHSAPSSIDLLIVGGGVMGLWAAVKAERLGLKTLLVEQNLLGQGASGGLIGALMAHMPDRWSEKKQFQFDALVALEAEIAELEAATGFSAGYRRCGRIIPLPKPHLRDIALRHEQDAKTNWAQDGRQFHWHVLDAPPVAGYLADASMAGGFVHDTLAARMSPRSMGRALSAFLKTAQNVTVVEGLGVSSLDPDRAQATLSTGETVSFGHVIVSAGYQSFPLLQQSLNLVGAAPLGQPVKGQSALMKADIDPAMPVLFLGGLYVVPHDDGMVAVGSTSEESFSEPFTTDAQLDVFIEQARNLVPALENAEVVERWAGLRPKAIDRDPMVGSLPEHPRLVALTGGFKVSFGLAHRLADAALSVVQGIEPKLPQSFLLESHIAVATKSS